MALQRVNELPPSTDDGTEQGALTVEADGTATLGDTPANALTAIADAAAAQGTATTALDAAILAQTDATQALSDAATNAAAIASVVGDYLPIAGGTLQGDLVINGATSPQLVVEAAALSSMVLRLDSGQDAGFDYDGAAFLVKMANSLGTVYEAMRMLPNDTDDGVNIDMRAATLVYVPEPTSAESPVRQTDMDTAIAEAIFNSGGGAVTSVNGEIGIVVLDAADIGILDAADNFVATNVEAALAELYDALTSVTGGGGGGAVQSLWSWNNVPDVPPVLNGEAAIDVDSPSLATELYLAGIDNSQPSVDYGGTIGQLKDGDTIYLQDADDAQSWHRYQVTGTPVLSTNTWTIPVTTLAGSAVGTEPPNNARILVSFEFALEPPSADEIPIDDTGGYFTATTVEGALAEIGAGGGGGGGGGGIAGTTGVDDNRVLRSDGVGGVTLQPSPVTLSDTGDLSGVGTVAAAALIGNTVDEADDGAGVTIDGLLIKDGLISGRDLGTDGNKLDTIEAGATADQSPSQIKTAYESNVNTNAFTDAEKAKVAGIEAGATADQTPSQIKTAYESNSNTNAFTDTEKSKLAGIEAGATGEQAASQVPITDAGGFYTGTNVEAALQELGAGGGTDDQTASEVPIADAGGFFTATDVEGALQELGGAGGTDDQTAAEVPITDIGGYYVSTDVEGALQEAAEMTSATNLAWDAATSTVSSDTGTDATLTEVDVTNAGLMSAADKIKLDTCEAAATGDQTATEIKTLYESNADTNAFTDAEQTKLQGIETGATGDQSGAEIKTLYEAQPNTNAFTDANVTKLAGIETGATADLTGAEIKSLYEAQADTNAFTDAAASKLAGIDPAATGDQAAADVPITDAAGNFTATDVEGALAEIVDKLGTYSAVVNTFTASTVVVDATTHRPGTLFACTATSGTVTYQFGSTSFDGNGQWVDIINQGDAEVVITGAGITVQSINGALTVPKFGMVRVLRTTGSTSIRATGDLEQGYVRSTDGSVTDIVTVTQAEYDALGTPDPTTSYLIVG